MALGQREYVRVFGNDYPTPDGTAVRDYIHVMDIAEGHVSAVDKLINTPDYGCKAINLGECSQMSLAGASVASSTALDSACGGMACGGR